MPLYEYECPGCGRLFEKRNSIAKADEADCPHCGNRHPRRMMSRINIGGQSRSSGGSANIPISVGGT